MYSGSRMCILATITTCVSWLLVGVCYSISDRTASYWLGANCRKERSLLTTSQEHIISDSNVDSGIYEMSACILSKTTCLRFTKFSVHINVLMTSGEPGGANWIIGAHHRLIFACLASIRASSSQMTTLLLLCDTENDIDLSLTSYKP